MKHIALILFIVFYSTTINAQTQARYSQILIDIDRPNIVQYLIEQGLEIDHSHKHGHHLEVVVSENDMTILNQLDLEYEIEVFDLAKSYEKMMAELPADRKMDCGLVNFDKGSMGDYHSYADMQDHIFSMQLLYPELVTVSTIGMSHEGREIYAVKISDNVNVDETDIEGVVYYDAITHAREPMGLETILFYMWTLLENYGIDNELTYLVNNREIYFVPVVNPDGYVYNQTTNPNGGGLWRKNRKVNNDGSFGVDLNRNYEDGWGLDIGSSGNPSSSTYRGPEAFSEPESRTVRDFTNSIKPSAAFSNHTYSDVFLCPLGYSDNQPAHDIYSEIALDMLPRGYGGYGNWEQMIFYYGSGSAHDYLHSQGTIAMTPEIGHSFWENPTVVCERVNEMYPSMKYLTWISGGRAVYQNHRMNSESIVWEDNECQLEIRLKNKGLGSESNNVIVHLNTADSRIEILDNEVPVSDIPARTFSDYTSFSFIVNESVLESEPIVFHVEVTQDGIVTSTNEIIVAAGMEELLFTESSENGLISWETGNAFGWNVSTDAAFDGTQSMTDSPFGNYEPGVSSSLIMSNSVDLTAMDAPWLEFSAKWSFEPGIDYAELKLSDDGGDNWFLLTGEYSDVSGKYTGHQSWIRERIDLTQHVGKSNIILGFFANTDISREADGFYFDDLRIVNYGPVDMVNSNDLLNFDFKLFPNPAHDILQLDLEKVIDQAEIKIFNAEGKLMRSHHIYDTNSAQIPVKDLNSGVYTCQIQSSDGLINRKFEVIR